MRIRRSTSGPDKVEQQMTPMIDVVFQLNIFFLFTFKIVALEGDFNVRMPSIAAARSMQVSEALPMTLKMRAGPNGELADMRLGDQPLGHGPDAFARLRQRVRAMVKPADAGGPGTVSDLEVEIDIDYDLHYDYVMQAITAVTGYIENNQPHKLIERIKFTPPKKK